MSRVTTVSNITLRREAVAPGVGIYWNPVDNTGTVTYHVQFMRYEDDEYKGMEQGFPINVSLTKVLEDVIEVQTPKGVQKIPGTLLMAAVKAHFEKTYEAYVASTQPKEDTNEATP